MSNVGFENQGIEATVQERIAEVRPNKKISGLTVSEKLIDSLHPK
jgi:hypothetical protein